jgi:acyl carrier protein phosphodiesterase
MNFLGHAYFSPADEDVLAGNMFGDFVKGDLAKTSYSAQVIEGLRLHRAIDARCEDCESYLKLKKALNSDCGLYRGVVIDILSDYMLTKFWHEFSEVPLAEYADEVYASLEDRKHIFPKGFLPVFELMKSRNWFVRYQSLDHIRLVLNRFSQYARRKVKLEKAVDIYLEQQNFFHDSFFYFMEEISDKLA